MLPIHAQTVHNDSVMFIVNVEHLMVPALDIIGIELIHEGVGVGSLKRVGHIGRIQTVRPDFLCIFEGHRLTAAVYAAARARHNFNKVKADFFCKKLLDKLLGIAETAYDRNAQFAAVEGNGEFLHAFGTANAAIADAADCIDGLVIGNPAENSLGNAAGCAENDACTGEHAERCIDSFGNNGIEFDAGSPDHVDELLSCDNSINIGLAVMGEFAACSLEFFAGARHYGDVEMFLFAILLLLDDERGKHLHRGFAGGDIGHDFGMLLLCKLNPAGAAGSEQGHSGIFAEMFNKFCGFFKDGEVGTDGCVVYLVDTHAMHCGNEFAHDIGSFGHVEFLADRNADGGSNLRRYNKVLIGDRLPNLCGILLDGDCTDGADCRALTAADAYGFGNGTLKSGADEHMRTAVRIVDRADGLNLVAHTDALTAEDALACIAGDAYGRIVNIGLCGVGETNGANIITLCKLLKFAVSVLFAGVAVAAMVCKQQLDDILAILAEPFGVCINLHAGTGLCGTCSIKTAALVFKHAHTACAVDGQLGVVAKCGHVDARLADNFKDVLLAVKLNGDVVNIHKFLFHCLFLPDCVERAGGDTCAAAETLCKVNMERALKLAADRACGALPCALGAAFADCGIDHDSLQPCAVARWGSVFRKYALRIRRGSF